LLSNKGIQKKTPERKVDDGEIEFWKKVSERKESDKTDYSKKS
jgi:hypothetical protein